MQTSMPAVVMCCLATLAGAVLADDDLKAFPPAEKGMVRYVVKLPKQDDESALQIELIAGITMQLDAANSYFFDGKIEEEIIHGWGYPRYVLKKLGSMGSTLLNPVPNAPRVERFVTLSSRPFFIRYNSRLPVVMYAPQGVEIRYRVWRADPKIISAEKG